MTGDYFTYCYLSPFVVGLLGFGLIILVAAAVCMIISKVYNWIIYDVSPVGRFRKSIDRLFKWFDKWVLPVLAGGFCIFVVFLLAHGAWSIGLEILKRAACR